MYTKEELSAEEKLSPGRPGEKLYPEERLKLAKKLEVLTAHEN